MSVVDAYDGYVAINLAAGLEHWQRLAGNGNGRHCEQVQEDDNPGAHELAMYANGGLLEAAGLFGNNSL